MTDVIDGDTFTGDPTKSNVRLENVNAAERNTTAGRKATEYLKSLIHGKMVQIQVNAHDVYGRRVAEVKVDGRSVNDAMKRMIRGL